MSDDGTDRMPPDLLLRCAVLCNRARLVPADDAGDWRIQGDPTEGALLVAARKAGVDEHAALRAEPGSGSGRSIRCGSA